MATADAVDDGSVFESDKGLLRVHRHETSDKLIDPWCDLCFDDTNKEIEASGFCTECNTFLCKSCLDAHMRFPAMRRHRILQNGRMPKTQADKPVKYVDCDKHQGYVNDHFCMNHREMVCSQCICEFHRTCYEKLITDLCTDLGSTDIQALRNATETIKKNVTSVKYNLEQNNVNNQTSNMMKEAKELQGKLILKTENAYSSTVSDIDTACDKILPHLSEQVFALSEMITPFDQTLSKIDKITGVDITPHVFIELQNKVANVRQSQTEFTDLNKQLCKVDLSFSTSPELSALLSANHPLGSVKEVQTPLDLTKMPTQNIAFPSPPRNTSKLKTPAGRIARDEKQIKAILAFSPASSPLVSVKEVSSQLDPMMSTPEIPFPSPSRKTNKSKTLAGRIARNIMQTKATKLTPLNVKTVDDKQTCHINGMTLISQNMLLLADWYNEKVKAVSPDNKILSSLTLSGLPYDVTVIDETTAAVSTINKKLHILDISDPGSLAIRRTMSLGYWACGVSLCNKNLVVVKWTVPRCVKMISLTGTELWSISTDYNGQQLFEKPLFVTAKIVNDKLTIIVTDWGKQTITLLDANNGNVVKTVDVKGKSPQGLTVDNNGNVYVCCRMSGEICVWSGDFSQSRILLSGSDLQPNVRDIVFCDSTDEIFICYYSADTVDRFKLS